MRLQQTVQRAANRHRTIGTAQEEGDLNVFIEDVNAPKRVDVNDSVTVSFTVRNDDSLSIGNPDFCTAGFLAGISLRSTIDLNGQGTSWTDCYRNRTIGLPDHTETYSTTLTAPATGGTYDVTLQVFGSDTGLLVAEETRQIVVEDDNDDGGDDGGDDGDDGNGGGGLPDVGLIGRLWEWLQNLIEQGAAALSALADWLRDRFDALPEWWLLALLAAAVLIGPSIAMWLFKKTPIGRLLT